MNINHLPQREQELLSAIDNYIEKVQQQSEQPATIKRNELEDHIESKAETLSIQFEKDSTSIQTYYTFFLEGQNIQVELFYRYQNFYTRHKITPL
ncbi:hypothetical protein D3H55_12490 [Bacillus salacetis]|uniref:Uncharacterized protein n=1 Tax=Bacillus salacetis TaxID=2315464 RepID=A0A3A1QXW1_9BACI|nr:hypothetical protein [Bacillus salacetis]RIW32695.1 hypothetical protein D3H55_12490 [Bacillus salacetis]